MEEFELEYTLEKTLQEMAINDKKFFSPHYVCAFSGVADLKEVAEFLLSEAAKKKGQKIYVYYEVECPEGDSDFSVTSPDAVPNNERCCHICGTKYIPNPDRIWIGFNFTEKYKEFVKKKETLQLISQ